MPLDSKEIQLGSSDQEASSSAGKNTGVALVSCRTWKCVPTAIFVGVDFWGPWCHLLQQMGPQWGSQKLLQGLVSHELTAYHSDFYLFCRVNEMAILSKARKPDKFEPHNSLKLWFTNIGGLPSNFVRCQSLLKSYSPDILILCETNLNDSIDSGNFSVKGYLPRIRTDSVTHMHGLVEYVKETLPFARAVSLENTQDSNKYFRLALLHSVSHPYSSVCTVLILFHLT